MATEQTEAKDVNGQPLAVGNVCIYFGEGMPDKRGRRCVVRAISPPKLSRWNTYQSGPRKGLPKAGAPFTTVSVRVDDDIANPDEADKFTWSAWALQGELAKV